MKVVLLAATLLIGVLLSHGAAEAAGVTYTYDGQGRVVTATYANGTVITYTYDTAGNIVSQSTNCSSSGC